MGRREPNRRALPAGGEELGLAVQSLGLLGLVGLQRRGLCDPERRAARDGPRHADSAGGPLEGSLPDFLWSFGKSGSDPSSEPRAVVGRRDADELLEAPPHRLLVGEAAVARHLLEARRALLDPPPGLLDAQPPHVDARARAEARVELPREVARAHAHAPREALD